MKAALAGAEPPGTCIDEQIQPRFVQNTSAGHDVQTFVDKGAVGGEPDDVDLHGEEGGDDPPLSPRAALRSSRILGTAALVASAQRSIISIWEHGRASIPRPGVPAPTPKAIQELVRRSRAREPLIAPTRVSPAPTTEYEQHDENDQYGLHGHSSSPPATALYLVCACHAGSPTDFITSLF
jgi:hypothetical protein